MIIWFLAKFIYLTLLIPLQWGGRIVAFFHPFLRQRIEFEKKNFSDPHSESFKKNRIKADVCFEFSSEGEYQQIASLVEDLLSENKKVELVYFSPSVDRTMADLGMRYPHSIRILRYPLFFNLFSSWATAPNLILVRYDLFPEFLIWSLFPARRLMLVWFTFKKERLSNKSISLIKKIFLKRSSKTIFASALDLKMAEDSHFTGVTFDFRVEQIHRRILKRHLSLLDKFPFYPQVKNYFDSFPRDKSFIFGNVWPEDIFLLENLPQDFKCLLIPHKLDESVIETITAKLSSFNLSFHLLGDDAPPAPAAQIVILAKKGILCELYADFSKAYVGGGFGESIHSVLEPLVAGCDGISCGPVNFRSTEFDIAESLNKVTVVNSCQEFQAWLASDFAQSGLHDKLIAYFESYPVFRKDLLSC